MVSHRHQSRLLEEGGRHITEPTYPLMVVVHTSLFLGSVAEVWWLERAFIPPLGWGMLSLLAACVAGRIWVWRSLGEQWNTQVVASTRPIIDTGPYRYVRHPNYTIVIVEMFALPLTHTAYLTALVCSILNAFVLQARIQVEETELFSRPDYAVKMAKKPRFLPAPGGGR
ncbi:MAG: isoprenylcysteine carboxyl methyltransferase family protein [Candidatus Binatia bacterium]